MGSPIGPTSSSAGLRQAGYAPNQGMAQVGQTNMQPRYSQPGMAMIRPGFPMGQQLPHQALATALNRLGGSSA
jgi:hypothetical protein